MIERNGVIDRIGVNGAKVIFTLLGESFAYTVYEKNDLLCLSEKGDSVRFECDDFLTVTPCSFQNNSLDSIRNL
tara:strand:+ start:802 stop:1023 length:222 start_codon:yes stop_codon:yes gene_type:complete